MYRYDEFDQAFVDQRVEQFRGQTQRRLIGELTEEEFKPLRLMNGLYLQLHGYMLRVAIPYGTLDARQMRALADISEKYDKGYGHFTTRQNVQFNWPKLQETPDLLADLAKVEMHAIQTSGNCIRNVTADHWAGVAADELADPRPVAELIRQWSSLHPEFSFLPRKFKVAVTGAPADRAAVKFHDIGLRLHLNEAGERGWEVIVGGGQGRFPMVGVTVRDFLPEPELLGYLEAIMRVYNLFGRRDNKYKARIKILIHETGTEEFSRLVEEEYAKAPRPSLELERKELDRIASCFAAPDYETLSYLQPELENRKLENRTFARWVKSNVGAHRAAGYGIVDISLKPAGGIPGDTTAEQMRTVADLAERFSHSEIRVSHHQNLVLPDVKLSDLYEVWTVLSANGMGEVNIGLLGDIISCPGLDYCALATARSIPIAQSISRRFSDPARQEEIGPIRINISGCINACGHHHVGHIGILGLEKKGKEFYQITLGGNSGTDASIGAVLGKGFSEEEISGAIETIVDTYLKIRDTGETFLDCVSRIGTTPFKEALYAPA